MGATIKKRAFVIRMWIGTRVKRGNPPTDDAVWARIKETWPYLPFEAWKAIFEATKV